MRGQVNISLRILRPLIRRVFYVDRKASCLLSRDPADRRAEPRTVDVAPEGGRPAGSNGLAAAILGRSLYFEISRRFPITSARDIRKAVELEKGELCPFPCNTLFVRSSRSARNESTANVWFLKDEAVKRIEMLQPALVIPETALLKPMGKSFSHPAEDDGRLAPILSVGKDDDRILFGFVDGKGICVSLEETARDREESLTRFRRMIGHEAAAAGELSMDFSGEYLGRLVEGLFDLGLPEAVPFFYRTPFRVPPNQRTFLARGAAVAAAMLVLYLGGSSVAYYRTERNLTADNREKKARVAKYVDMEDRLRKQAEVYEKLVKKVEGYAPCTGLLTVLNERLPEGTVLTSLRVAGSEVQIQGRTPKATRVIDALNGQPVVEDPRFVTAVGKAVKDNLEEFTIAFRLKAAPNR